MRVEEKIKLEKNNEVKEYDVISILIKDVITIPNLITASRAVGTVFLVRHLLLFGLAPMTIAITSPIVLPILASVIAITDTLDGYLARKYDWKSKTGELLDTIVDKIFTWGVALSVLTTGILPITSALLLTPILCNDLYVGYKTTKDKKETNLFKKNNKKQTSLNNVKDIKSEPIEKVKEKLITITKYLDSNHMKPTIYGKLKMWGLSCALISGLAFGFVGNSIYIGTSLVTGFLCVMDSIGVHKRSKTRKKYRKQIINGELNAEEFELDNTKQLSSGKEKPLNSIKALPVIKRISSKLGLENRTEEEIRYVNYLVDQMEKTSEYIIDTSEKEKVKSLNNK